MARILPIQMKSSPCAIRFCSACKTERSLFPARIAAMLTLCSAQPLHADMPQWADFLLSLERLDEQWTNCLLLLKHHAANTDISGFDVHMAQRQTEYEQLLVYFVYRHLANACDETDLAAKHPSAHFPINFCTCWVLFCGQRTAPFPLPIRWSLHVCILLKLNTPMKTLMLCWMRYAKKPQGSHSLWFLFFQLMANMPRSPVLGSRNSGASGGTSVNTIERTKSPIMSSSGTIQETLLPR